MRQNSNLDNAAKTVEGAGNVMQGIGRVSNLIILLILLGGGAFVYHKVTNWGAIAIDAGKAVIENGGEAVVNTINDAGEAAGNIRDAAIENAPDVDLETAGERATDVVDGAIDWIGDRKDRLDDALDRDSSEEKPLTQIDEWPEGFPGLGNDEDETPGEDVVPPTDNKPLFAIPAELPKIKLPAFGENKDNDEECTTVVCTPINPNPEPGVLQ